MLFLAPNIDAFISTDLEILQRKYDVEPLTWRGIASIPRLASRITKSDIVFSWFAGDHSATASLISSALGIPHIVVSGGVDVANMPEINYGAMSAGTRKALPTKVALGFATIVLAFSEFSSGEIARAHDPRVLRTLYLGVDTRRFSPAIVKEGIVLTVGQVSAGNLKRKGMEPFVSSARRLPQYRFILAGKGLDGTLDQLRSTAPPNLTLPGFVPPDDLVKLYAKSRVYVQASAHEGFGVALAEAMSSGCIPVISNMGALPEVAGDVGQKVTFDDDEELAEAINRAMSMPASEGFRARKRIQENFDLDRREEGLTRIIDGLIEDR